MQSFLDMLMDPTRNSVRKLPPTVRQPKTYRDHPLSDGTARYDDVWGA